MSITSFENSSHDDINLNWDQKSYDYYNGVIVIIICVLSLFGFCCNACLLGVVSCNKKLHTTGNYLLAHLAVVDLIFVVSHVLQLFASLNEILLQLFSLSEKTLSGVSILTILLLAFERYKSKLCLNVWIMILITWLVPASVNLLLFRDHPWHAYYAEQLAYEWLELFAIVLLYLVLFVPPFAAMAAFVGLGFAERQDETTADDSVLGLNASEAARLVASLAAMCAAHLLPFYFFVFVPIIPERAYYAAFIFYYAYFCVKPTVYCFFGERMRKFFRSACC